jgi:hypothetical protein
MNGYDISTLLNYLDRANLSVDVIYMLINLTGFQNNLEWNEEGISW